MSEEQTGNQLGDAEMSTRSSDNDIPGETSIPVSGLEPRILSEPQALPAKRNLRQLICSIHARTSPKDSMELPSAELSRLVRYGDVLLRRLHRLINSHRRFIDLEPMSPLQEAITAELAKELCCRTRFYKSWNDTQYMVAYRPGVKPNTFEVRARRMCQIEKGQEILSLDEEDEGRLEPMSFRDGKLHWHQPMKFGDRKKTTSPIQDSLSLGRRILEEFNRDQPKAKPKQLKRNLN